MKRRDSVPCKGPIVLDLQIDKKGGLPQTNLLSREMIKSWMDESDLADILRQNTLMSLSLLGNV